jgi:hypothetical protein
MLRIKRAGVRDSDCPTVINVLEEVHDGRERQVGAVAEYSVAGLGQANQPCGGGRELAGKILSDW